VKLVAHTNSGTLTKKGDIICPMNGQIAIKIALNFQANGFHSNPTTWEYKSGMASGFVINTWEGITLSKLRDNLHRQDSVIWRSEDLIVPGEKRAIKKKELFNLPLPLP
jgi:hypothetical protein